MKSGVIPFTHGSFVQGCITDYIPHPNCGQVYKQ